MTKRSMFLILLFGAFCCGCAVSKNSLHTCDADSGDIVCSADKTADSEAGEKRFGQADDVGERLFILLPFFDEEPNKWKGRDLVRISSQPEIHGPYSLSLIGNFLAPSWNKLDEAYGVEGRFLIQTENDFYLGCSLGYSRIKNEFTKGLIEGELLTYKTLFWCEYRLRFGDTTWSPSVDFMLAPGWFVGEPAPLSEEIKAIEIPGKKLETDVISTAILRIAVQLRLPVLRSTDMSISEGNADIILGVGAEFGEGISRYTIYDYPGGTKFESRGHTELDAFNAFLGLSFRF